VAQRVAALNQNLAHVEQCIFACHVCSTSAVRSYGVR
jgi:hypothetical protein